jgi:hypothetical protein
MALLKIVLLASAVLLATACYRPELHDCVVTCNSADDCADGQRCGADGFCSAPDVAGTCGDGGAPLDGPIDGATDAIEIDADGDLDAAIDAAGDAGTDAPVVGVRVRIDGMGRVRDDAHDILCEDDCTYDISAGTELTLVPEQVNGGWTFEEWNLGPCAGGPEICVLAPVEDVQVRALFSN